jgi:hypothetical protein
LLDHELALATIDTKYNNLGNQRNLYLVYKELRDVGTPMLYKDMVLCVDNLDSDFEQVIKTTKNHRGLPHIRTICVVGKSRKILDDFVGLGQRRYRVLC